MAIVSTDDDAGPAADAVDGRGPSTALPPDPAATPRLGVPAVARPHQVAAFRPAILGVRGATTAVSVALAGPAFPRRDLWVVAWCGVIVAYNVFRIVRPLRYREDTASLVRVLGEVALHVMAVAATGYWESPFLFSLLTAVMVAGFVEALVERDTSPYRLSGVALKASRDTRARARLSGASCPCRR